MSKIYSLSLHFNNTMNINTHRLNKLGIFYFTKETLFNQVRRLDVSGCDLDCFPKRMGQLEKLFELMLKDKKRLVNPPECIKKMKSLIMVDIGGCELDYLPKGVG